MLPAFLQPTESAAFTAAPSNRDPRTAALLRAAPFLTLAGVFWLHRALGAFAVGDTFQSYAAFNYAYGNVLSAGELPQWLPYAAYGSPAEAYLTTFLGPFQVLALYVGAALRMANVWALFCGSIFAESACFVAGAYLLGLRLYRREAVACAVACWVAVSLDWSVQIFWPHRQLLYVPLLLLFTLRFHETLDLRDLLRTGVLLLLSVMGNNAYAGPALALTACAFFGLLRLVGRGPGLRPLRRLVRPGPGALGWLLLLCLLSGLYLFLILKAFDGAAFTAPDRDPVTGAIGLRVFLTYGGLAMAKLPEFILGRWAFHMEFLFYIGVAATGLAAYALRRVRSRAFYALASLTLLLFLLCLGPQGGVAYAAYWFPGMNRFRHLSYLLPMVRLLLFFVAGYGLTHVLERPRERARECFLWLLVTGAVMVAAKNFWLGWGGRLPEDGFALLLGLALLCGLVVRQRPAWAALVLGLGLGLLGVLEVGGAQALKLADTATLLKWNGGQRRIADLDAARAQAQPFLPGRAGSLAAHPHGEALRELCERQPVNNFTVLQFTGGDFLAPAVRIDYAMPGVLALLEQAQPGALAKLNEERSVEKTLGFFYWRQALAASWFREAFGGDGRRLMLEMPDGTRRDASRGVQAFSANRLTVDVDAGGAGAALYYADAWHPAWRAFVDGREAAVRLSRGAFKAVAVPPGRHVVKLSFYRPQREWAHRVLALGAVLVLLLLLRCGWQGLWEKTRG